MKSRPPRPTTVQLERLDARVREFHQQALKAGHLAMRQGNSLECAKCGASGSVHLDEEYTGGLRFSGSIFGEAPKWVVPKCTG